MVVEKQEGRFVGFAMAREVEKRVLPAYPVWKTREPNDFDDFGAEYAKVARRPFNPSRQRKKGNIVDRDDMFGFNEDLTQNNMLERLEEFCFAEAYRTGEQAGYSAAYNKAFVPNAGTDNATTVAHGLTTGDGPFRVSAATTLAAPLSAATRYWVIVNGMNTFQFATSLANALAGTKVDIADAGVGAHTMVRDSAIAAADDAYRVNDSAGFIEGMLVLAKGYTNTSNNGLKTVTAVAEGMVTVGSPLVDEAAPPVNARLKVVGFEFEDGDVELELIGARVRLSSDTIDFGDLPLIPGQWVFLGGDAVGNRFLNVTPFYARIAVGGVAEDGSYIEFDKTTATVTGGVKPSAGLNIQIFFGDTVKNEDDPDLIKRITVQAERTLGRDDDGIQSECMEGGVANELTWNSPLADKVTLDMGYIAMYYGKRKGDIGPKSRLPEATLLKALGEDAFNTTSNIFRLRLSIIDETLNPTPLFARVTEWSTTINNNTSGDKAQGTLGAFDTTSGMFEVDGEFTVYFSTLAAIQSIEDNADVTFDAIYSKQNAAVIKDIPLIGTGGGGLDMSVDEAIMLPIETAAAESPFGHTVLYTFLSYVPNAGVASG